MPTPTAGPTETRALGPAPSPSTAGQTARVAAKVVGWLVVFAAFTAATDLLSEQRRQAIAMGTLIAASAAVGALVGSLLATSAIDFGRNGTEGGLRFGRLATLGTWFTGAALALTMVNAPRLAGWFAETTSAVGDLGTTDESAARLVQYGVGALMMSAAIVGCASAFVIVIGATRRAADRSAEDARRWASEAARSAEAARVERQAAQRSAQDAALLSDQAADDRQAIAGFAEEILEHLEATRQTAEQLAVDLTVPPDDIDVLEAPLPDHDDLDDEVDDTSSRTDDDTANGATESGRRRARGRKSPRRNPERAG